jgi:exodeoxyribonuclease VII small subunit
MTDSPPKRSPRRRKTASATDSGATPTSVPEEWLAEIQQLSFQEARTALELAMAQLQANNLEVEQMTGLYRRARAYAERCEAVLDAVQQDVIQWDTDAPTA